MELQEKLTQYRKEKGLSQVEVAEELGVSRQAVSRWETGAAMPTSENLICLSKLYGVTLDKLIQGDHKHTAAGECAAAAAEDSVMDAGSKPAKPRPHNKIIWITLLAFCLCGAVFIWGELTNSRGGASIFIEFVAIIVAFGWLIYAICKMIIFLTDKRG